VLRGGYQLSALDELAPVSGAPLTTSLPIVLDHSRPEAPTTGTDVVLRSGERLTVVYEDTLGAAEHRLFVVARTSSAATAPMKQTVAGSRRLPTAFALSQNEPNPFGDGTVIRFALPVKAEVVIEVFDVHGRRVQTLTKGQWQPGEHALTWNARGRDGGRVAAGVYLYRMTAGSFRASRKLAVLP
jgi:hypothetical protein